MEKVFIFTDGGARGNPGPAGIGVLITNEAGDTLHEISTYIGEATNNFAEYEALILALTAAKKMFATSLRDITVEVKMDSELVVRQMQGRYKVKEPTLKVQNARAQALVKLFPHLTFTHIPREQNSHADKLVNAAIDSKQ